MTNRTTTLALASLVTFASVLTGQNPAATAGMAFASNASQANSPSAVRGQAHILEMVGEKLNLTDEQNQELQLLLQKQRQAISAVRQDFRFSDDQKELGVEEVKQQTRVRFVAMLSPEQKREFSKMMRERRSSRALQADSQPTTSTNAHQDESSKSQLPPAELDEILNSFATDAPGGKSAAPK
jgi:Spy/CpxP family protein refolding chaperone